MRSPRPSRAAVVVASTAGFLLVLAGPAMAHHAEVLAVADCSGQVHWTVQAWSGVPSTKADPKATELSRTNPAVAVDWGDGGDRWHPAATAVLGPQNGFTDTGTFSLPSGAHPRALQVRVTVGRWANGHVGGSQRVTPPQDLTSCAAAVPGRSGSPGAALPITLGGGLLGSAGAWLFTRRRTSST